MATKEEQYENTSPSMSFTDSGITIDVNWLQQEKSLSSNTVKELGSITDLRFSQWQNSPCASFMCQEFFVDFHYKSLAFPFSMQT